MRDEREPRAARATGPGEPRPDEGHTGDTAELPLPGELLDDDGQPSESAPATQPQPQAIEEPDRRPASLVIQTSFLGDMVLTTPLIEELAARGPVDVVATPAAAALLANNPHVRDVIRYDKRGDARGLSGLWRASRTLRERQDGEARDVRTAYLAQGSARSAMLALLAGIRERVGFETSAGRALYTRAVAYRDDRHHAERLWRLSQADDAASPAALRPRLYPGLEEVSQVDALLKEAGHTPDIPLIALAPGSVWATKRWPGYPALAAALAREFAGRAWIVTIGGVGDALLAAEIVAAAAPHTVVDAMGRLSLLASAELIDRCAVLVTNDSAPQHLASAMGTPTVALFGPTVPEFGFGPLAARQAVLGRDDLPCRPCHRHGPEHCPLGHWRCMMELAPDDVAARTIALLDG